MSIKWDITVPKGAKLVWMEPLEFLKKTPSPCATGHTAAEDIDLKGCFSELSLQHLKKRVEEGKPLDALLLDYEWTFMGWPSHEGRHRALLAHRLGEKRVPVIVYGG